MANHRGPLRPDEEMGQRGPVITVWQGHGRPGQPNARRWTASASLLELAGPAAAITPTSMDKAWVLPQDDVPAGTISSREGAWAVAGLALSGGGRRCAASPPQSSANLYARTRGAGRSRRKAIG